MVWKWYKNTSWLEAASNVRTNSVCSLPRIVWFSFLFFCHRLCLRTIYVYHEIGSIVCCDAWLYGFSNFLVWRNLNMNNKLSINETRMDGWFTCRASAFSSPHMLSALFLFVFVIFKLWKSRRNHKIVADCCLTAKFPWLPIFCLSIKLMIIIAMYHWQRVESLTTKIGFRSELNIAVRYQYKLKI